VRERKKERIVSAGHEERREEREKEK